MIIVRSPLRISYFGGGTDLPSWYENNSQGGAVIASAINKYSYINIRYLDKFYDHKFRIRYFKNEEKNKINKIEHPIIKMYLKNIILINLDLKLFITQIYQLGVDLDLVRHLQIVY